jgi:amino acid transporter
MNQRSNNGKLKRNIGLPGMVFYGVGTMVGGGIYALLGKIVQGAGMFTPLALLLAGSLALLSAFSFAELTRRYPVSAGEVQYVHAAFGVTRLSQFVGVLVILTGLVSAATLCAATGGFLLDLTGFLPVAFAVLTAVGLTGIAAWGVSQSVAVVVVITLLEAGTLLLIILLSADNLAHAPARLNEMVAEIDQLDGAALVGASFLAFYAFIGFEDMVNMAEETRNVERTLPLAIFIAVAITIILYLGVGLVAMGLEDGSALATAHTPLALLLPQNTVGGLAIGLISVLAGVNGALVQVVMASRVFYGMANRGLAPSWFAQVNARTRTPVRATLIVGALVLVLATAFPLATLAATTSAIILGVFAIVNLSLARLRWTEEANIAWLPLLAAATCVAMLLVRVVL